MHATDFEATVAADLFFCCVVTNLANVNKENEKNEQELKWGVQESG